MVELEEVEVPVFPDELDEPEAPDFPDELDELAVPDFPDELDELAVPDFPDELDEPAAPDFPDELELAEITSPPAGGIGSLSTSPAPQPDSMTIGISQPATPKPIFISPSPTL